MLVTKTSAVDQASYSPDPTDMPPLWHTQQIGSRPQWRAARAERRVSIAWLIECLEFFTELDFRSVLDASAGAEEA